MFKDTRIRLIESSIEQEIVLINSLYDIVGPIFKVTFDQVYKNQLYLYKTNPKTSELRKALVFRHGIKNYVLINTTIVTHKSIKYKQT